jgi:hypothetical protein
MTVVPARSSGGTDFSAVADDPSESCADMIETVCGGREFELSCPVVEVAWRETESGVEVEVAAFDDSDFDFDFVRQRRPRQGKERDECASGRFSATKQRRNNVDDQVSSSPSSHFSLLTFPPACRPM